MYLHTATGGLAAGTIAGIVIAAVVFAVLHLIVIAVIVHYIRLHAKNQKSTFIVNENNHTNVGDLQSEYHRLERSQLYAQTSEAKDSTHSDNQSNTVLQESDRRRFLKRGVRRIFARDGTFVFFNTVLLKLL